jgi:hypothetical protein
VAPVRVGMLVGHLIGRAPGDPGRLAGTGWGLGGGGLDRVKRVDRHWIGLGGGVDRVKRVGRHWIGFGWRGRRWGREGLSRLDWVWWPWL